MSASAYITASVVAAVVAVPQALPGGIGALGGYGAVGLGAVIALLFWWVVVKSSQKHEAQIATKSEAAAQLNAQAASKMNEATQRIEHLMNNLDLVAVWRAERAKGRLHGPEETK